MSEYQEIVLGQMLMDNNVWHESGLVSRHFTNGWCRQVFDTISSLIESGHPANIVTVTQAKTVIDPYRVPELTDKVIGDWRYNANQVKLESRRHFLLTALKAGAERIESGADADAVISDIEDELVQIALTGQEDVRPISQNLAPFIDKLEERFLKKGELPGISTGYAQLDAITGGFEPGRLWYLGARPSKGKSALLLNMLSNVASEQVRCGLISLESSEIEAYGRIFANKGSIFNDSIRAGTFRTTDLERIKSVSEQVGKWKTWICDNPEMTISQVKSVSRKMVIAHHVQVLFIDYLQYIREDVDDLARKDHVAATSRALKAIARQLNVPVVCAAQLRRDVDDRRNNWPRLGDFAESSQVEKDADVALLLHEEDDKNWWCIEKNRDGGKGVIPVEFDMDHTRFTEIHKGQF